VISVNAKTIGFGSTAELSLRVSAATATRVTFSHPDDGGLMLALEHQATLVSDGEESKVFVRAQPFGGAILIQDIYRFNELVGGFRFDCESSQDECDFRIFIRPSAWADVREFCKENMGMADICEVDSDPTRELKEEFKDTLGVELQPEQCSLAFDRIVVEEEPTPTRHIYSVGNPTIRIYRIDAVHINDQDLCKLMIANSETHPQKVLKQMAITDAQNGGKGRANAVLAVPVETVRAAFLSVSPEKRGQLLEFGNTLLEGNVALVLKDVFVPKYS
jgi:hypothetical protein